MHEEEGIGGDTTGPQMAFGSADKRQIRRAFGYYVAPTVVTDLPEDHYLWKQEMFLPIVVVAGFVMFRFFDISKLPPARQLERLPGGLGVMADDWAAAVYSHLALRALLWAVPSTWIAF